MYTWTIRAATVSSSSTDHIHITPYVWYMLYGDSNCAVIACYMQTSSILQYLTQYEGVERVLGIKRYDITMFRVYIQ